MNSRNVFFKSDRAGIVVGFIVAASLVGCIGYVYGPRDHVHAEAYVFDGSDDYIYYPFYDVYYCSHRNQYAYMQSGVWVLRPAPHGVSIDVLVATPSVRMDFHDSPASHHKDVARNYPKNWAPKSTDQGREVNKKSKAEKPDTNDRKNDDRGKANDPADHPDHGNQNK